MGLILSASTLTLIATVYMHHIQKRLHINDVIFIGFTNLIIISVLLFVLWERNFSCLICWGVLFLITTSFVLRILLGKHRVKRQEKVLIIFIVAYLLIGLRYIFLI
ncbi:hypothetical protein [Aquimarina sp. 2201CG1-2-11]|uniref:hypothetical protein n=1 Tax=Aquimarina discodermiae TaxID=3231043 RepID=UPI00346190BD